MQRRETFRDRHAARPEHVCLRAVLQRLFRVARRAGRKSDLLGLHQRRAVSGRFGRGAIDPCFPAKIGIAHVHNLLSAKSREEETRLDLLPDGRRAAHAAGEPHRGSMPVRPSPSRPKRSRRRSRRKPTSSAQQGVALPRPADQLCGSAAARRSSCFTRWNRLLGLSRGRK